MEMSVNKDRLEAIDKYDSCIRRVEIVRELLLEGFCAGSYLPEDEYKRKEVERSLGYYEAAIDVLDIALMEYRKYRDFAAA